MDLEPDQPVTELMDKNVEFFDIFDRESMDDDAQNIPVLMSIGTQSESAGTGGDALHSGEHLSEIRQQLQGLSLFLRSCAFVPMPLEQLASCASPCVDDSTSEVCEKDAQVAKPCQAVGVRARPDAACSADAASQCSPRWDACERRCDAITYSKTALTDPHATYDACDKGVQADTVQEHAMRCANQSLLERSPRVAACERSATDSLEAESLGFTRICPKNSWTELIDSDIDFDAASDDQTHAPVTAHCNDGSCFADSCNSVELVHTSMSNKEGKGEALPPPLPAGPTILGITGFDQALGRREDAGMSHWDAVPRPAMLRHSMQGLGSEKSGLGTSGAVLQPPCPTGLEILGITDFDQALGRLQDGGEGPWHAHASHVELRHSPHGLDLQSGSLTGDQKEVQKAPAFREQGIEGTLTTTNTPTVVCDADGDADAGPNQLHVGKLKSKDSALAQHIDALLVSWSQRGSMTTDELLQRCSSDSVTLYLRLCVTIGTRPQRDLVIGTKAYTQFLCKALKPL
eukprot:TRINITY_DN10010_c0_g1_i1.p1 TRINITY_DN10010_c0_g1~~TRINITY_DN10010_c0_g1_i1.p1  ORF type:complete len:595 (-),score=78.95 TRINITY_DN10010_c0_g1_i1:366-1916(-)